MIEEVNIKDPITGINFLSHYLEGIYENSLVEAIIKERFDSKNSHRVSDTCFLPSVIITQMFKVEKSEYIEPLPDFTYACELIATILPFKYTRHVYDITSELEKELL